MKKHLIILLALIGGLNFFSIASKPRVYFAYGTYYSPVDGTYLEACLQFDATSLQFRSIGDNQFAATVQVLYLIKKGEEIIDFRKYALSSPAIGDSTQNKFTFIDIQRFILEPGQYDLEISLSDYTFPEDGIKHTEPVTLAFADNIIELSSLQLVESYEPTKQSNPLTKSGFDIVPYVDNFYPSHQNNLTFYQEIYNAEKVLGSEQGFLILSQIEVFETGNPLAEFSRFKREQAKPVNVMFSEFDISQLPSGNYYLVLSLKDANNQLLASNRLFFQRSNPGMKLSGQNIHAMVVKNSFVEQITNQDSLRYFLKALDPISTQVQREFANTLVATNEMAGMQQYFLYFWQDRNALQPEEAWKQYYIELCRADAAFKTKVKRGYETDRGRVFLQYGPPDARTQNYNEPSAFPHEIWHFYSLNGQRDKRFVFMTRDLVTNDFDLIHSDAIGEVQNHRWQLELHSRSFKGWDVDTEETESHWGSRSREYYQHPR